MKKNYSLLLGLLCLMIVSPQAKSFSERLTFDTPIALCIGDVTLSSQAQVDAFDCESIDGNLIVSGSDINNLDGLRNLKSVKGYLEISNNPSLSSISGFDSLTTVSLGVRILNNPSLTAVDGFNALQNVNNDVPGLIKIAVNANPSLVNLRGFSSLEKISVFGFFTLSIEDNARLKSVTAFSSLKELSSQHGEFRIVHNPLLTDLQGFSRLSKIIDAITGSMQIIDNDALTNLDAFTSLKQMFSLHGHIKIANNDALQNVDGLYDFGLFVRPGLIEIKDNPILTRGCGLYKLLQPIPPPPGQYHTIVISGNGPGVTRDEIMANGPCLDFTVDKSTICAGDEITFTLRRSAPVTDVHWSFGEGADPATATGDGPHLVKYWSSGVKNIELYATGFTPVIVTQLDVTVNQLPLDKRVVAEFPVVCPGKGTNVIVLNCEPSVLYQLRNNADGSEVSNQWPGTVGLFTGALYQTTTYQVWATDSITGCRATMTERPTVTVVHLRADTEVVAEYPTGSPGHATNIIVLNGDPNALYLLRDDMTNRTVAGPWPASVGLYTGPLYETTTFNVLSFVKGESGCEQQLNSKVTVTIGDGTFASNGNQRSAGITISPQPSDGNFDLQISNKASGEYEVTVYDLTGNTVAQKKIFKQDFTARESFNVTHVPGGLYVVSVQGEKFAMRKTLIIK